MTTLPHSSGRLIVALSEATGIETASAEGRARLRPLVAEQPLEAPRAKAGPPLLLGTPVDNVAGLHPWDAAHEAVTDASVLESTAAIQYAEPDFEQGFTFRRPQDSGLEARREPCALRRFLETRRL